MPWVYSATETRDSVSPVTWIRTGRESASIFLPAKACSRYWGRRTSLLHGLAETSDYDAGCGGDGGFLKLTLLTKVAVQGI